MFKRLRASRKNRNESPSNASITPGATEQSRSRQPSNDSGDQRPPRQETAYGSTLGPASSYRGRSPSPGTQTNTLGLHVVHQPQAAAPLDIIFVHGLGGDSRKTWSKNHDPILFWPGLWLPFEPDIGKARILSFGYNASFRAGAPRSTANIGDFAKELLFEMKFGKDNDGEDLCMGKVPIIFVVHSMGGLIAKKAYLLGQNDEEYQNIVRSVSAILFLATPHRGTNLAEVLSRVLTVSFQSPRNFINDLNKSSPALEELNEQFRHIAPRLSIVSFYETLATAVGPKKIMVLEKDSSILGYPKEISRALNADHHGVCKYSSPDDPNYVSVRNTLKSLVGRFRSKGLNALSALDSKEAKNIGNILGVSSAPEDDLNSFRRLWMPGTCDWLLREPEIQTWLEETLESRILWLSAPPATGKSILATHVIKHLLDSGVGCQYYYFKFGDQTKRSLGALLRSLAFQIAKDTPIFRQTLLDLSEEGLRLEKAESVTIWQKIFETVIYEMSLSRPLFWVIDALDESDSPKGFLDLLRDLSNSQVSIHILIVSRKTEPISLAFDRLPGAIPFAHIEVGERGHNSEDIQKYLEMETRPMRGSPELKQRVIHNITDRAMGNFLWVRLVLDEILNCHSEEAIQECLDEIPNDMSKMYERMELAILNNPRKSNRILAKTLLQWVICANRALTLKELGQALSPEFPEFLDLRRTIQDVCGQFVLIDRTGNVGMVHQTARDYLITSSSEIAVDTKKGHAKLFEKTTSTLLDPKLRVKLTQGQHALRKTDPFIFYSAVSWPYHLRHAGVASDAALDSLVKFFSSTSVLNWIQSLALISQLEILVKSAKIVTTFVNNTRRRNASKNPLLHRLSDLELLEQWTIDLVKVVGKFSKHLVSDPSAIYKVVPPLCPESSAVHRQFYKSDSADLVISGIPNSSWSDNLAKINIPHGEQAWKIACAGQHIAVLAFAGVVFVWNSNNFVEVCNLHHLEPVTAICFNYKGNKFVTYGLRTTKLWSLPSGQLLSTTPNPADIKAMAVAFAENDKSIVAGCDDNKLRRITVDDFPGGWRALDIDLSKDTSRVDGGVMGSPMCLAFNGDATQVGVSYRGFPLSVWDMNEARCLSRCRRAKDFGSNQIRSAKNWFAVDRFTWNPMTGHIIGIYKDGCIFKWHPVTDENQEVQSAADEVAASSDGKLFVTSNSNGTVRVWNFAFFSVIYQLSSADLVTGLVFSPDCRRFYDVRGCSLNAWESNSLIRFSEAEEPLSDSASESYSQAAVSQASEALIVQYEAVSTLASSSNNLYCVGNEEGIVELFDSHTGKGFELLRFLNFLSVSHLVWGDDGNHVAAADLGGEIMIKCLSKVNPTATTAMKECARPIVDLAERGIHQLLFSRNSALLLVISEELGQIVSVDQGDLKSSAILSRGSTRKWLNHPTRKDLFLGFGGHDIKLFRWDDFSEFACLDFMEGHPRLDSQTSLNSRPVETLEAQLSSLNPSDDDGSVSSVSKAIITQDGRHLLVQIKESSTRGEISKRLLVFKSSTLEVPENWKAFGPLISAYIPPPVVALAETPLGVLDDSRLVFLDQDLWVCTFKLGITYDGGALKRHYFIPRDWMSTDGLELCCMMPDGTLLCPRDDKVAVIRGSLETGDF